MSNFRIYNFPSFEINNAKPIEILVLNLQKRYREGESLDDVELTWLDQANNWLDAVSMSNGL